MFTTPSELAGQQQEDNEKLHHADAKPYADSRAIAVPYWTGLKKIPGTSSRGSGGYSEQI